MTGPVVVGVDGTDEGRRALRYGIGLARAFDAPLRLVHVRQENVLLAPMLPMVPDPTLLEVAQDVLDEAVRDAREMGWTGVGPEAVVANAPRVAAIVDAAHDARCIVLGTRSSRTDHLLTGSTSNGVAAHADVPVVCVPGAWDPDVRFHQVTVGFDGSPDSVPVVEAAAGPALALDSPVRVLHAWRPLEQYDAAIGGHSFAQRWEQETRAAVEKMVEPVRAKHPNVKFDLELRYERPVVALHTSSQDSDLLVIGRHGRHVRFGPRLGTTARTVIRTSACPVLVVPTPFRA